MDIEILKRFIHIARVGGVTRASKELCVAQPGLSKQVQRLEEELGAVLFERNGRSVRLTEAGQILLQHAQQIIGEWGKARHSIREAVNLDRGHCRLVAFVTFVFYLLPHFLVDFVRAFPHLELEIEQAVKNPLVQMVLDRKFEAGICTLPVGHPKIVEKPLYTEESVLVVNKNHPLYGCKEISAAEVGNHFLIVSTLNPTYRSFLQSVFQDLNVQLQVRYVVHYYPALLQMVRAGLGAGVAPLVALRADPENFQSLSVVKISPPLQRKLGWIEPRGITRSPPLQAFYDFLVEFLRKQDLVPSLV